MADIVINPAIGKIDFFTTKGDNVTNTLKLTGNTLLVTGPLSASSISTGGGGAFVTSTQPTANYLSKFTGNSTIANSLIYDNGTNVGIGTTSPGAKLAIIGTRLTDPNNDSQSREIFYAVGRTVASAAGSTTLLGYLTPTGRSDHATIEIYHHDCGTIEYIRYELVSAYYVGTTTDWVQLPTINNISYTGALGGVTVDARLASTGANIELRLRSLGDSCGNMSVYVSIKSNCTFTEQSTTGTSGTVAGLLCNNAYQFPVGANRFEGTTSRGLYITNAGNVGIGTQSPAYKLDVSGNARFTSDTFVNGNLMVSKAGANLYINGSNSDAEIHWQANGTSRWAMGMNVGDATENLNIYNYTTSTTNFTILKASGNVGIGSSSPVYKLDVNGIIASSGVAIAWFSGNYNRLYEPAGNPALYLGNNTDPANYYDNTTHYFRNRGGSTNYAIINSSGNLGVGTTVASYKVDVVGAVRATIDNDFSFVLKRSATNVWTGLGYYTANNSKWFVGLRETGDDNLRWYNYTNSAERMVLTEAGSLGVGTTSPGTKLDVVGEITTPVIKQSATLYSGTDITDDNSTRTVYFNIPLGGYSPPKYFKVARIKITGNYQNVSLNGYFTTTNSTGLHVGSERKVEFDFIAYAATNPGAPTVTYLKRGPDTTNVLVYAVPNGGGAGTTYYDVYIKSAWYNDTNGELAVRVGYSSAVTIWQAGLDSGTSAPTDTLVNPNSSYSFDTSGNIGIGTTSPAYKLDVYGPVSLRGTRVLTTGFDIFGGLTYDIYGNIRVLRSDSAQADGMYIGYGGSGGPLRFFSNTGVQEFMTIATTGNVGIGSTSPSNRLEVISGSMRVASAAGASEIYFGTLDSANIYLKRDNNYDLSLVQNASSGNSLYLAGAGNVYLSIDSNNNETTAAFIVQNNAVKAGTELFRVNEAGSAIASSDFRAPIFYDSNNTSYYVDPASTSNLNAVTLNNAGSTAYLTLPGNVTISNVSSNEMVIRNLGQLRFSTSTSWDWNSWAGLKYDASVTTIYMGGPAATSVFSANATPPSVTISFVGTTAVNSDSSFRAPIFYDSANTAYYVDPASTSNVNNLTTAGTLYTNNIAKNANGSPIVINSGQNAALGLRVYYDMQLYNSLFFTDSSWNNQGAIFGSGGNVTINAATATTSFIKYAGYSQEGGSFRAPIFYDSDNTSYYVDPASTSNLNILSVTGYQYINGQTLNGQSFYQWEGATYRNPADHTPQLLITKTNSTTGINGFAPALALYNNNGADQTTVGMTFVSAEAVSPTQGNSVELAGIIAKKESTGTAGGWSRGSLNFYTKDYGTRKDVMYMSPDGTVTVTGTDNNSGKSDFSVDTGGTATMALSGQYFRVGSTDVNWAMKMQSNGYLATYGQQFDIATVSGDNAITFATNGVNRVNIGGSTTETVKITGYANYVGNYGYNTLTLIDTSGYPGLNYRSGNNNWLMRMDGGGTYSMNWSSNASAKDVGTFTTPFYFGTGGTAYASNDFRAPIFYDANNTSYYLDPASTSNLNVVNLIGITGAGNAYIQTTSTGTSYTSHFQIREASGGGGSTNEIYAPALGFHWSGVVASNILMESSGRIAIRNNPGSGYENFIANAIYGAVFYDSNDTTYYLDPSAATSLNIAGQITTAKTNGTLLSIAGADTIGYNGTAGRGAYIKGTSTTYVYGSGVYYDGSNIRQMLYEDTWLNNKYFGSDGIIYSAVSMRAPIFYDYNDTNYYLDPNGGSILKNVNLNLLQPRSGVTHSDIYAQDAIINSYYHGDALTYDVFQFRAASLYEIKLTSTHSFSSTTVETSIFKGDRFGGMTIANNTYQVRWTWSNTIGYKFFKSLYIGNSTNGNSFAVTIEYSGNGSTWTTLATSDQMSNWPGHSWYNYAWNNNVAQGYLRLTITPVWSTAYDINIYNMRYFASYNLDAAVRLYDWDYSRNVTFANSVTTNYGTFASPGIILGDAQYGFYVSAGNVYYKSASGGVHYWRNTANSGDNMSLDNSGILSVAGSVRSPIFYDSNNTSYYVDPASTGYSAYFAGAIQATKIGIEDGGIDCYMEITDANPVINGITYGGEFIFYGDKSTPASYLYFGGATVSNILQANGSLRAPIFYDSDDTTYYLDAASTSLSLKTRSSILINNASSPQNLAMLNIGYNGAGETRAIDIYGGWSGGENKSISFTHGSTAADIVAQINGQHNGPGSKLRFGKLYHGGNSSTYTMELISESTTSAYLTVVGSVRSPIFYDSDNTAYYLDPNSTSNLVGLTVANTITGNISGNAATATNAVNLSTTRTNWSTNGTITAVVGQLCWKNYGNNHTIIDASNSTSPAGGAIGNTNPDYPWTGTYPTLMGWNGANTYGVRVDSSRYADQVGYAPSRTDSTAYPVLWGSGTSYTVAYSCAAVTIQSSTGTLNATNVNVSGKLVQNSTTQSITGTGQTLTLNVAAAAVQVISMASGATITTISYTNRDNNPSVNTIMLVVKYAGSASITFTNVLWANGTAPTLTGTSGYADVFMLTSYQGGAGTPVWIGTVVAQALVSTNL